MSPFEPDSEVRALRIVWEEEDLAAVDKPAGLLSQGGPGAAGANVVDLARAHFGRPSVGVLHRLDRNVSGLVLVSLAHDVGEAMSRAFQAGEVERRYEAVVKVPRTTELEEQVLDAPLVKDAGTNLVRVARGAEPLSKPARTRVRLRSRIQSPLGWLAVLDVWPLTGRSHQIRAHLAHAGLPLLGDPKYGVPARGVHRPLLHAIAIAFVHPRTGHRVALERPAPWSLAELSTLRRA